MSDARFSALRPAFVLSLLAMLGACTAGRIDYRFIESAYDGGQDHWAPYSHSLRADVSGNPFPIAQDDFNKSVNEAIQPTGYAPDPKSAYRLRMIFNGPATNSNYICGDHGDHGSKIGVSAGQTITLSAGYCRGDDPMTFVQGSIGNVTGPDDPRFKDYLRLVTIELFPLPQSDVDGPCAMMSC